MEFDVQAVVKFLPRLLEGAQVTIEVSLLAIVLGLVVGVILAVAMQTRVFVLRAMARTHISFARGTPLLIQILIVFFVLPAHWPRHSQVLGRRHRAQLEQRRLCRRDDPRAG